MIATASANIRTIAIAVNIFGAAEGFLPRALIPEKALAPITKALPNMHKANIIISERFLDIFNLKIPIL